MMADSVADANARAKGIMREKRARLREADAREPIDWRAQHDKLTTEETVAAGQKRKRVDNVLLIDRYRKRQEITDRQYAAGWQLRCDWTDAGREPMLISKYRDLVSNGAIAGFVVTNEEAMKRYVAAIQAVGVIASSEVIGVCLLDEAIGRYRFEILRRGLDVLADHYRIPQKPS